MTDNKDLVEAYKLMCKQIECEPRWSETSPLDLKLESFPMWHILSRMNLPKLTKVNGIFNLKKEIENAG